jgi:hypothetical protein
VDTPTGITIGIAIIVIVVLGFTIAALRTQRRPNGTRRSDGSYADGGSVYSSTDGDGRGSHHGSDHGGDSGGDGGYGGGGSDGGGGDGGGGGGGGD